MGKIQVFKEMKGKNLKLLIKKTAVPALSPVLCTYAYSEKRILLEDCTVYTVDLFSISKRGDSSKGRATDF